MTISKPKNSAERPQVLIVEDDSLVRKLLAVSMRTFGFDCAEASNGREAMKILEQQAFEIVVTDMVMPEVSGMELLAHIKGHYPQTSVIVVTGYNGVFSYVDVIQAGASDFIIKPFNSDELEAKIKRILREKEMVRRLEFFSNCDSLTELFNRRYLDQKIKEEVHRADRQGYPFFLIMLDVDNFKAYNDEYGHQEGDKLLIKLAKILKSCTRADVDLVFRHGGDEFAVTAPYISAQQVAQVGERIIALFNDQGFGTTSLSLGAAEFVRGQGQLEDDIFSLFRRADQALYTAKNQGRNRLVFSAAPPSPAISEL